MKLTKTTILLMGILCTSASRLQSQTNAIAFDGTNDYVQLANSFNIGTSNFTFEVWVKPNNNTAAVVFGQDINGDANYQFRLSTLSNKAEFTFSVASGGAVLQLTTPPNTVPDGEWTHIAVTRDVLVVTIYINGVVKASTNTGTLLNNQSGADPTKPFRIGSRGALSNTAGENLFNGSIDNLSYWNIARTQAQIKAEMFKTPAVNKSGLVALYTFDEGTGTTLANSSTNTTGIDGTLTNGPTWQASPVKYTANAMNFDGADDYVAIGAPMATNSSFTKEAWVYSTNTSGNRNIISSSNNPLWITGGSLKAGIAGTYDNVTDGGGFPMNTWVHVAVTFDDPTNTMKLYKDGVLINTNTNVTASYTAENTFIGSHQSSSSFFAGAIDEVRIWNVARTQAEIQNNRMAELNPANEPNLTAYYSFNEGVINGSNAGMRLVPDLKGNFNGTITNFALSGSSSNYIAQYAPIVVLPVKWNVFTATPQAKNILLQWSTSSEQNTRSFTVQHSTDLSSWKNLGTLAAAGSSNSLVYYRYTHLDVPAGNNYYRIQQTDKDGVYTYSEIRKITPENTAGIFTVKNSMVSNGSVSLQLPERSALSLYNMQGILMWKKQLAAGSQEVSVQGYSKGMYILKSDKSSSKIVIQ